jgi:uncharacterized protein YbjT (DUF2867 family)
VGHIRRRPRRDYADAIIAQLKEDENTKRVQPQVDAFIAKYTEIAEGADTASLTPEGSIALVNA